MGTPSAISDKTLRALAARQDWPAIADALRDMPPDRLGDMSACKAAVRAYAAVKDDTLLDAWLARAMSLVPDDPALLRTRSLWHQRRGEWAASLDCARRAALLRPDVAAYVAGVGLSLQQLGRHEEAVAAFQRALVLDGSQAGTRLKLANSLSALGRGAEAPSPVAPRPPDAAPPLPDAGSLRNASLEAFRQGDWAQALALGERAVALRPEAAGYHGGVAQALFRLGRYSEAAAAFQRALAIDPGQRSFWIRLGRALAQERAFDDAADAYRHALAIETDAATLSAHDELVRQAATGKATASAVYYDAVYAHSTAYAAAADRSVYAPVWATLVDAIRGLGATRIVDLGCGPGQFAEFLAARLPEADYLGIDFSGVAIDLARVRVPAFRFEQRELPIREFAALGPCDLVVCTEVLEHVVEDREIVAALPAGTPFLATVPSFESFGHIRTFRDEQAVVHRYGALLTDLDVGHHEISPGSTLWILRGRRSAAVD